MAGTPAALAACTSVSASPIITVWSKRRPGCSRGLEKQARRRLTTTTGPTGVRTDVKAVKLGAETPEPVFQGLVDVVDVGQGHPPRSHSLLVGHD